MKNGPDKRKITYASVIGCILTLQLGALSVTAETLASGITELPFGVFAAAMQPIHLAIGLVGRTDHCCGALFPVRGQAGAYLDR